MKKSSKIIIGILVVLLIISGFFIFLLIDHTNTEKKIEQITQNITKNSLTDEELDYLTGKKLISDDQKNVLKKIKDEVVATNWDGHNIEKLEEDDKQLTQITTEVRDKLTSNIKDQVIKLNENVNKLKPITDTEKKDKDEYLKVINEVKSGVTLKELINQEQGLSKLDKKIDKLEKSIKKSKIEQLLKKIPSYLTADQIFEHGIQTIDYKFSGYDTVGKNFYPKKCQLSNKFELASYKNAVKKAKENDGILKYGPKIDQRVNEYHHKKYYMTYYNTNYDKITTITDEKNNKTYVVYSGSYKHQCKKTDYGGGAAILIAYDIQDDKIVSVVGTQNITQFVINGEAIGFFLENGKSYYKELN